MVFDVGGVGFEDMEELEVEELIELHAEELTDEDLAELMTNSEDEDNENEEMEGPNFNLGTLAELFRYSKQLTDKMFEYDPSMEQSLKVKREIEAAMMPYRKIYKDLQKKAEQLPITMFLCKPSLSTPSPSSLSPLATTSAD
ncbi:hypothetical protein Y1Q_0011635 [Alligator mississippiensis]|uniref:Uncharacterized protein n=1 Tax=Alligator mississippiensis TaxID=8496 RepID=A0A151M0I6_ALLMI|nr:hypothetical protein Y1Q_0011635 [Alligator mississippiensis]